MKVMPSTCEQLINSTYNYISGSSARMHRFKTLEKLSNPNAKPKSILRPVATRWTSIYYCIVRNLRLWPVLTKFFEMEVEDLEVNGSQARDREMNPQELCRNYKDQMMLLYQFFLEWALKQFVDFNEKFQSEKSLASEKQMLIVNLYKFFLNIYMNTNFIKSTPAELIDPHDINNFLPDNEINLPDYITDLINTYIQDADDVDEANADMVEFKSNCKNYARHASAKIEERFDMQDSGMFLMHFLNPQNALSRAFHNQMPDFVHFFEIFPKMMPIGIHDVSVINREWNNLLKCQFDPRFIEIKDTRRFWAILHKFENREKEPLFKNICKVAYNALSLPNSNAPPERIWSRYNFLKNKWRASFKSSTVKEMIQAHEYIKSVGGALNFKVNKQMLDSFNSINLYSYDDHKDDVSEGDMLLEREEFNLNASYMKECTVFDKLFENKERGKKVVRDSDESDE